MLGSSSHPEESFYVLAEVPLVVPKVPEKATNGLKILFVSPNIYPYFVEGEERSAGGSERQQYLLGTRLATRGFNITYLTFDENHRAEVTTSEGINVIPCLRRGIIGYIKSFISARRMIWEIDPDIIYTRGHPTLCLFGITLSAQSRASHLYCVANDRDIMFELNDTMGRAGLRAKLERVDQIITQTNRQRNYLEEQFSIDSVTIPNGYPIPEDTGDLHPEEREYFLWVGSLDPDQKKPTRFLELAQRLNPIPFRMIGAEAPGTNQSFMRKIERMDRRISNFEYVGYVNPSDIGEHYKSAIALVNTSDYEGFPNTFLEAWVHGTPVVSLKFDLDNILEEELVGFHSGNIETMADQLEELHRDRELLNKMSTHSRKFVEEHFQIDTVTERYTDVFFDLVEKD